MVTIASLNKLEDKERQVVGETVNFHKLCRKGLVKESDGLMEGLLRACCQGLWKVIESKTIAGTKIRQTAKKD